MSLSQAHSDPLSPLNTTATYRFPACVDLIFAPVSSLAQATTNLNQKNPNVNLTLKSLQRDELALFPSLRSVPTRSRLGSVLEPTVAELVRWDWTRTAGGKQRWRRSIYSRFWYCVAALIRFPPLPSFTAVSLSADVVFQKWTTPNFPCSNTTPSPSPLSLSRCVRKKEGVSILIHSLSKQQIFRVHPPLNETRQTASTAGSQRNQHHGQQPSLLFWKVPVWLKAPGSSNFRTKPKAPPCFGGEPCHFKS